VESHFLNFVELNFHFLLGYAGVIQARSAGLLFAQLFCGLSSLQKRQAIFGHRNAIDKDDLMLLGYN